MIIHVPIPIANLLSPAPVIEDFAGYCEGFCNRLGREEYH